MPSSIDVMKNMVFVSGFARGGTSWLRDCIGSHPEIAILPTERTYFRDIEDYGEIPSLLQNEVSSLLNDNRFVVNKAPANSPFIAKAATYFSESKFIFIIRDPRDVLISHQRGTKAWMQGKNSEVDGCMDKLKKYYEGYCKADHLSNVMLVRYEDLHQNFSPTLLSIFEFIGVDSTDELISNIYEQVNFSAQTSRANKEDRSSAKRKGVIGDWGVNMKIKDKLWFQANTFFLNFLKNHSYDMQENTYANIIQAMVDADAYFLGQDDLLSCNLSSENVNIVAQHDIDYLNKDFCFESVLKTAEIEAAHGISAQYNFLPLDDSRYSSRGSLDTINLIKELQSINKRAYIGLHVNACEKFYAYNAPNDPSSKYLPEILDYVRKQVDDYEKLGIKFLISTAHGYARGKKVPNNRDTPEIAQVLDEYGITLFDTRIRVKLMKDSSYSCAITDVGGILKPKRLGEGVSLVNKDTYNILPKKTFIRFLTHPGNYHVDAPSVIAMRTF